VSWYSAYLANTKLAKLHIAQAREDVQKKNLDHACKNMLHALELTAINMNNVARYALKKSTKK
jgi:hypothetical protein